MIIASVKSIFLFFYCRSIVSNCQTIIIHNYT